MAISAKELYEQALSLDEDERAALANLILQSLEPADPDAEQAWADEIERRVKELKSGSVKTIPWDEVRSKLNARLESID
jgi:putative addiction module component (TIGR02574 family)